MEANATIGTDVLPDKSLANPTGDKPALHCVLSVSNTRHTAENGRNRLFSHVAVCYNNDMVSEPRTR